MSTGAPRRTPRGTALTVYTPSAIDPETLQAITVGRTGELGAISDALHAAATSSARSHVLIVGARGSGKSHLLALVAHRIRTDPELRHQLDVVQLPEDDYSILSYRDLLVATLDGLGVSVPPTIEPSDAESVLVDALGDRVLVLMVENFNMVCDRLGIDGQRHLRAFLHNRQKVVLLASTPALFAAVSDHDQPLYGSFQPIHLTELSLDEGRELLLQVARRDGDDALGTYIADERGRARLRVVSDLTGGSPRLWLLLAGCMTMETLDELVPLFITLLDELTPYYKARLDELAPVQAKLVTALARGPRPSGAPGGAMTVAEIAAATGMTSQTTSKQLGALEKVAFVRRRKVAGTDQRSTYYELREPLLSHCLDLKRSGTKPLEIIVGLLRAWYEPFTLHAALVEVEVGTDAERYLAQAVASDRLQPIDFLYGSGRVEDLISGARTALQGSGSAPAALRPIAVVAAEVIGVAVHHDRQRARGVLDDRFERLSAEAGAALVRALSEALAEEPPLAPPEERAALLLQQVASHAAVRALAAEDRTSLGLVTGGWLLARQQPAAALAILTEIEQDAVSPGLTLAVQAEMAYALGAGGRLDEALAATRTVLAQRQAQLGPLHPDTLTSRANEAHWVHESGDHSSARELFAALVPDCTRSLGPRHTTTLAARLGHARAIAASGDHAAARDLFTALVEDCIGEFGPTHPNTLTARGYEAGMIGETGAVVAARDLFSALLTDYVRSLGSGHPDTLTARWNLAWLQQRTDEPFAAISTLSAEIVHDPVASDLLGTCLPAAMEQLQQMIAPGHEGAEQRLEELGATHPDTLAIVAVMSIRSGVLTPGPLIAKLATCTENVLVVTALLVARLVADVDDLHAAVASQAEDSPEAALALRVLDATIAAQDGDQSLISRLPSEERRLAEDLVRARGGTHDVMVRHEPTQRG